MRNYGFIELNAFIAVAAHRSFRKAAVELGISPSTLSHAITSLERRLGVRLLNRTTRSVSISEAGEKFLARVSPALHQISEAVEDVNQFRNTPTGKLRLCTTAGAAHIILVPLVQQFLKRYPDMHVDLIAEKHWTDIVYGGFDAGIRLSGAVPQDMLAIPCTPPLRFVIVGSPKYFEEFKKPVAPDDLHSQTCINFHAPSGEPVRWEFGKDGKKASIEVTGGLTLDEHYLLVEAALNGIGLARVIDWFVSSHIAEGRLIQVLDDWSPAYPGQLSFYYPSHRHATAGLQAFISLVREFFQQK